jgi:uncharacterized membrane protein YfcA
MRRLADPEQLCISTSRTCFCVQTRTPTAVAATAASSCCAAARVWLESSLLARSPGSVAGGLLLGNFSDAILVPVLAGLLVLSSIKVWRQAGSHWPRCFRGQRRRLTSAA